MKEKTGLKREGKCPECGCQNLIQDNESGEIICSSCGLVIKDQIMNTGPEWRAFNPEQRRKRTRIGAPETSLIHDKGLSTNIGYIKWDAHGRKLSQPTRSKMRRLRRWQRRSKIESSNSRTLVKGLAELALLGDKLQVQKIILEETSLIFRRIVKRKLIRGRSITGLIAACLFAACRLNKIPLSVEKIAEVSMADEKDINRDYRFLIWKLKLDVPAPVKYHSAFVQKLANNLHLSTKIAQLAFKILKKAEKEKLTPGKDPKGLTGAAIYIACRLTGETITQKEIAKQAKVTEVTIRNRYKELTE